MDADIELQVAEKHFDEELRLSNTFAALSGPDPSGDGSTAQQPLMEASADNSSSSSKGQKSGSKGGTRRTDSVQAGRSFISSTSRRALPTSDEVHMKHSLFVCSHVKPSHRHSSVLSGCCNSPSSY
jgi:hypothetical protein